MLACMSQMVPQQLPSRRLASARLVSSSQVLHSLSPGPRLARPTHKGRAVLRSATIQCAAVADKKQTFTSFDDMLKGAEGPVLVDFYATWCGPCQLMSNIITDVAAALPEDMRVVKIDTDKYPQLASRLRVQALPTLMLFRDGKLLDRMEGVLDQRALANRIRYYLRGLDAKFGRSQR